MSEQQGGAEQSAQEENKLVAERREKLSGIRDKGNAFPNDFRRSDYTQELQDELGNKDKESLESLDRKATVAGRIMAKRGPFLVLQDVTGRIQMYVDKKQLAPELLDEIKGWDIGDIVGAAGVNLAQRMKARLPSSAVKVRAGQITLCDGS